MINEIVTGIGLAKKGYDFLKDSEASEIDKLINEQAAKRTARMAKFDNDMARSELAELLIVEGRDR